MTRRTHRLAAALAAALTAFSGAALAAAEPQPKPASSPSCEALAESADDLNDLKGKLFGIAGTANNATKNGLDIGSLIGLYGQSQEILRSLREESGKLRTAADDVHEQDLHDSTISLADTFDEGSNLADQVTSPGAPKEDLSGKVTSLTTHASSSLQRFGDSYQKHCGTDLELGNLSTLAKNLSGMKPNQEPPGPQAPAPSQQAPAPVAPSNESTAAPAPASNRSLLAPAPIK